VKGINVRYYKNERKGISSRIGNANESIREEHETALGGTKWGNSGGDIALKIARKIGRWDITNLTYRRD